MVDDTVETSPPALTIVSTLGVKLWLPGRVSAIYTYSGKHSHYQEQNKFLITAWLQQEGLMTLVSSANFNLVQLQQKIFIIFNVFVSSSAF